MPFKDKAAYAAYMNEYMKQRYATRRAAAIVLLGGKCVRCKTTLNLEFDHIDPSTKVMSIARASSVSEERWQNEISKCQLLCEDCHLKKTAKDRLRSTTEVIQ